jgi:predicted transcriptional regulator
VTQAQQHAISVIACLTRLHGRAPTLGEIAGALGVTKVAICLRLRWLEKKGLCDRSSRAVTEPGLRSVPGLDLLLGLLDRPPR